MPRINYNAPAMINVNRMSYLDKALTKSMHKIASGERITRAADDVSGHNLSERLRAQIKGLNMASRNIQDGISLINVAEGALQEVHDMLHRMRELSVQAANGTMTDDDRANIMVEINKLREEVDRISETTTFNGQPLLSGKGAWGESEKGGYLQVGTGGIPNSSFDAAPTDIPGKFNISPKAIPTGDFISHKIPAVNAKSLGIERGAKWIIDFDIDPSIPGGVKREIEYDNISIRTQEDASESIDKIMAAVDIVNEVRTSLGGIANRLEYTWRNNEVMAEDTQAYESKIRDTDIAEEMISVTRDQIIKQYCTAMLAQANQTPQSILQLLK
ncbi:MAG: flagellin [Chitinispirillales bacterium]|jgi:flagellin|nr:flagellin [Chitinispirillales bacterium]